MLIISPAKCAVVIACLVITARALENKYHSNAEIEDFLKDYTRRFPYFASFYSIGKSKNGTELTVGKISAAPEDKLGVPNVKLIANIHGNEPVGREVLLEFLKYIGENYGVIDRITWLVNNTRIHVLPTLNPDGFEKSMRGICEGIIGRNNAADVDLNRNFPDYYHENHSPEQPEARAVKFWLGNETFVLSASLHGGALVANYPFDSEKEKTSLPEKPPSIAPDDDVFRFLASSYANSHLTMHTGKNCGKRSFLGGITNGAQWYSFIGGMQDYNYFAGGCMELTLELSCCKYPVVAHLPRIWDENREALIDFCYHSHKGVKGLVLDAESGVGLSGVSLKIAGRNVPFRTNKKGEFWRVLLDGYYQLEIAHPVNNKTVTVPFEVKNPLGGYQSATNLLIKLTKTGIQTETTTTPPSTARPAEPSTDRVPKSLAEERPPEVAPPPPKSPMPISNSISISTNINSPLAFIAVAGMLMVY